MGTKPLIFLSPLSERLNELKESIESTAEDENIEIYDIESLEELNQLIHHLGQFLLLTASPKHCASFLQKNMRSIKSEQSKVILITSKQFPSKIVDRLNKLGLTDLILETVAPKTLQYKVKLQLRSITGQKEEEAEVHIKHEEESEHKSDVKSTKDDVSKEEALYNLKKKILESESQKEKSYPGKASLVIEEDLDPDTILSGGIGEKSEEELDKTEPRTLVDVEKETELKKKNLPWHKAKEENLNAKGSTEKINNVWSNKKKDPTDPKDLGPGNIEGKSSTDKLQKERAGEIAESEKSIETHWEGEVAESESSEKDSDTEENFYNEKIEKHYEGSSEGNDKIKQDFDTAESSFKEEADESMTGDSAVDKTEGDLKGDSTATKMSTGNLSAESSGIDHLEESFKGKNNEKSKDSEGNMLGEGKTAQIKDELEANVEELRALNKNASLKSNLTGADRLDKNRSNDSSVDRLNHDSMSNHLKNKKDETIEKKKRTSLLDQVKKNRANNKKEELDGFMRSPNAQKKDQVPTARPIKDDEIEMAIPLAEKTPIFNPSDFSADLFENDEGTASTERQENEALSGASNSEEDKGELGGSHNSNEELEGLTGDSERSEEFEDLSGDSNKNDSLEGYSGEAKVEKIEGDDLYGDSKKKQFEIDEESEKLKKKQKLEELYALKEKKLQELKEKKKKEAALNTEENFYKKERDWDEKSYSMDSKKEKKEDIDLSPPEYEKSKNQNLEALTIEKTSREKLTQSKTSKKDNYDEEVLEQRSRHEREEVQIDLSDLTDMERELINGNKDWGEQTIDYSKLDSGMDAISTDREASDSEHGFKITEREIEAEAKLYQGIVLEGDIQADALEDEEGDKIIHPDAKGLESVINILNLYFDPETMPSQVLNKTAELMNKEKGFGVVSFFYKKYSTEEFTEILNGHSLFSNDQRLDMWEEDKKLMIKNWGAIKLPTWSDKTFRESKIDFIYPYYEGVDQLGFAVVNFSHGMKEENCQRIEITLEAARSVYLTQRHKENGEEAIYSEKKTISLESGRSKEKEEGFMKGSTTNLIYLEKAKAEKEALEIEKQEEASKGGVVKKFWKRMFG